MKEIMDNVENMSDSSETYTIFENVSPISNFEEDVCSNPTETKFGYKGLKDSNDYGQSDNEEWF